ncbi:DUF924 family protein [Lyngbya sp. CCY1209]|uniref:DUF924 family protein n=1 Tax=Lyngbya sp. CCY1209 TaxID=2886103 RepID=UPI002D78512F|nr:DUF924 family protein [Lyngbya sp. CCY1209]
MIRDRNLIMSEFERILNFWFGEPTDQNYSKPRKVWFQKKPKFDAEMRSQFLPDYDRAARGELNHWREQPDSCLALILLLDQFPRNLFRGTPKAFATDDRALETAKYAIARGFDRSMIPVQRWFFYLPLEHSENLKDQYRALGLFRQLSGNPESASSIDYARRHFEVIKRFGRFPHRNEILGRSHTPEEREFLKQPGSSF